MCINKLADIVNEHNNVDHSTIKIKSVDVKLSTYMNFNVKDYNKNPKFEVGDHVRISE